MLSKNIIFYFEQKKNYLIYHILNKPESVQRTLMRIFTLEEYRIGLFESKIRIQNVQISTIVRSFYGRVLLKEHLLRILNITKRRESKSREALLSIRYFASRLSA